MNEGALSLTFHGVSLAASLAVLGIILKQHKVWVRMKDRVNQLWYSHCKTTGDKYESLENGRL